MVFPRASLFGFLRSRQRGDVRVWAQEIASTQEHRALAMDQWEFLDTGTAVEAELVCFIFAFPSFAIHGFDEARRLADASRVAIREVRQEE